jgi:hypothetical protein
VHQLWEGLWKKLKVRGLGVKTPGECWFIGRFVVLKRHNLQNSASEWENSVMYGDWYLPSKYELNLLSSQRLVVGGFSALNYWSSSESSANSAHYQNFGSYNYQDSASKDYAHSVSGQFGLFDPWID